MLFSCNRDKLRFLCDFHFTCSKAFPLRHSTPNWHTRLNSHTVKPSTTFSRFAGGKKTAASDGEYKQQTSVSLSAWSVVLVSNTQEVTSRQAAFPKPVPWAMNYAETPSLFWQLTQEAAYFLHTHINNNHTWFSHLKPTPEAANMHRGLFNREADEWCSPSQRAFSSSLFVIHALLFVLLHLNPLFFQSFHTVLPPLFVISKSCSCISHLS